MSLIDRPTPSTAPPLVAGERLDRATFHNRYERTAPDFHAELIGGMVYVRSRVDFAHGEMHFFISDSRPSGGWARRNCSIDSRPSMARRADQRRLTSTGSFNCKPWTW
jgi:hypothetical protein